MTNRQAISALVNTAQHTPGPKLPSLGAVRQHVGSALRPIREALHKSESGAHRPAVVLGYRFTGRRLRKVPGQIGYAWSAYYTGTPLDGTPTQEGWGTVGGNLDEVAAQLHDRMRKVWPKGETLTKADGDAVGGKSGGQS